MPTPAMFNLLFGETAPRPNTCAGRKVKAATAVVPRKVRRDSPLSGDLDFIGVCGHFALYHSQEDPQALPRLPDAGKDAGAPRGQRVLKCGGQGTARPAFSVISPAIRGRK